jgi:hypothetical protein
VVSCALTIAEASVPVITLAASAGASKHRQVSKQADLPIKSAAAELHSDTQVQLQAVS